MKYYCLGNPIVLVKTQYSDKWLSNVPFFGTPIFGKLPMTQSRMRSVYDRSPRLVLCRTLEEIEQIMDMGDYCRATVRKDREGVPDIAVYQTNKSDLNMRLITGHYLSLIDGREEVEGESMCRIL